MAEQKKPHAQQPRTIALCAEGVSNSDEASAILQAAMEDLITGELSPKVGNEVSSTIGKILKAAKQDDQDRIRELSEDLKKLALLEQVRRPANRAIEDMKGGRRN